MEASSSSHTAGSGAVIQALVSRGWSFGDVERVKSLITLHSTSQGHSSTVDAIESDLINMDLRSIGGKSLPDPSLLRKSSHLQGPKVLQVSSVRDISRSSISDSSGNPNHRRLLRLGLTDGHSEITAVEYSHMPSIADNVAPGTKVRLESKAAIHNNIVCLNTKAITVLGGMVQSLYEEWEMNQKYLGLSRSSLKKSKESENDGPPPFEKLQVGALSRQAPQGRLPRYSGSTSKSSGSIVPANDETSDSKTTNVVHNFHRREDGLKDSGKSPSISERTDEKASRSEARPKEVVESVPIQNQAAAQKLLQKMSQPAERNFRGRRHRRKETEEESHLLTLEEWERRNARGKEVHILTLEEWERKRAGGNPSARDDHANVSQDEDLARMLQSQFDLEHHHVEQVPQNSDAEELKNSMFSFQKDDAGAHDRAGFRGRGRGGGRGRRGRGRGRF